MVSFLPQKHKTDSKTKLTLAYAYYKLVRFTKNGFAGITLISEENWWQFFLHIVLRCLANHRNDKFTDILKCTLRDFDKYEWILFIFAKYIFFQRTKCSFLVYNTTPYIHPKSDFDWPRQF